MTTHSASALDRESGTGGLPSGPARANITAVMAGSPSPDPLVGDTARGAAVEPVSRELRREFLKQTVVLPAAMLLARQYASGATPVAVPAEQIPCVPFGRHAMSRLICGTNTFNAGSHLSTFVNRELLAYYTPERILQTLRRCAELGINFFQATRRGLEVYPRFLAEGGRMQCLTLASSPEEVAVQKKLGSAGIAHHGETTDSLFKAGRFEQVHEVLKRVRDAGLMVGVSTHMPAVVEEVEARGWDVDYYMTCVYERNRSAEELKRLLGHVPLSVREVYLEEDPPRMYRVIRQTRRTCLAFKILAAGRLCESRASVERAFREAFEGIKPNDAIIVGLYDRYSDQPGEDAEFTRRFGARGGR